MVSLEFFLMNYFILKFVIYFDWDLLKFNILVAGSEILLLF